MGRHRFLLTLLAGTLAAPLAAEGQAYLAKAQEISGRAGVESNA